MPAALSPLPLLPPSSSWYTPGQALAIALTLALLDLTVNVFGLAWNGNFFTFANIAHWFDFRFYNFSAFCWTQFMPNPCPIQR